MVAVQTQTHPDTQVAQEVVERVAQRLPGIDETRIRREVTVVLEEYADSKVRSFLPILVERAVVARVSAG